MKRETLFLKVVLFLMALPVIALCIFVVPPLSSIIQDGPDQLAFLQYVFVALLYATAVAYFVALYQTYKLLSFIDDNIAFSVRSVTAIKNIKRCALVITGIYVLAMPLFYIIAEIDDAPGLILMGAAIGFGALVIAVFAAVLQKLLTHAIDIKSENDLTV
ncbi:DUF2975 domain-containing protein [Planococcus alpniumensis]|uniref:DUF2975 domain-containing protein n=1 Tax=Planococcus alpniumensis TaxID=2708345 RepID=UPI001B8D24B0|nr:DUF2975 domain-containing protein [Planococcus sp. MSAK28401]